MGQDCSSCEKAPATNIDNLDARAQAPITSARAMRGPSGKTGKPPPETAAIAGQTIDTGAMYEGEWRGEEKHGIGKLIFSDGSRYEGTFEADRKHGRGKYTYSNGSTYEGEWRNELQDGHGIERLADGSCFEGQFRAGDKSGQGKFTWKTGGTYEGSFDSNDMHGEGTYRWSDGREYRGQWVRNSMGPRGTMHWPDGKKYEGDFVDGKKHGEGRLSWLTADPTRANGSLAASTAAALQSPPKAYRGSRSGTTGILSGGSTRLQKSQAASPKTQVRGMSVEL
eukprot:CAMPEP_0172688812 /NCGR_PEP_ID=MMETSP1074-20121228/22677_1 /TAXON_ID=2916 /ORGANISM="Ceratium fusus, Strain PA161109" /LENGTH=280 /DNA_ID=CAMNT_0013508521 /DNA_START=6 /DNA_END=845 /DNA_ORIENTATION=-